MSVRGRIKLAAGSKRSSSHRTATTMVRHRLAVASSVPSSLSSSFNNRCFTSTAGPTSSPGTNASSNKTGTTTTSIGKTSRMASTSTLVNRYTNQHHYEDLVKDTIKKMILERAAINAAENHHSGEGGRSTSSADTGPTGLSSPPPSSSSSNSKIKKDLQTQTHEQPTVTGLQRRQSSISDDDIDERFQRYQRTFEEAEQCLKDLREFSASATTEPASTAAVAAAIDDEVQCAKGAVEATFTAYIDLLEDLRKFADDGQLERYNDIRHTSASELRRLRKDLDLLITAPSSAL